ncbi:hypothetical protein ADK57_17650 [Streptomyces sp. MMG1533]|nr:hypothetical protein ADK57_17650 [Streptomyces sp. MMG1533]
MPLVRTLPLTHREAAAVIRRPVTGSPPSRNVSSTRLMSTAAPASHSRLPWTTSGALSHRPEARSQVARMAPLIRQPRQTHG